MMTVYCKYQPDQLIPMMKRFFLFVALFAMLKGVFAQPLEYQFFPYKKPHTAPNATKSLTEFGPFHADPYVFTFDHVSDGDGFYGYRVDIKNGEPTLVKKVDIGMTDGTGKVIGIVHLVDRFAVAYYFEPKKSDRKEYRIASLDLKNMELMGPPMIVDDFELKDGFPFGNNPLFFVSPNQKKMLFYFDGIRNKESSLVHLVIVNDNLEVDMKRTFERPHYVGYLSSGSSRQVDLGDDGSVYAIMRGVKPGTKGYTDATDRRKISDVKLHVYKETGHLIVDLPIDYFEPYAANVQFSGKDYFLIDLNYKDGKNTVGYRLLDSKRFEPFFLSSAVGEVTNLYGRKSGGWNYVLASEKGVTIGQLSDDGELEWRANYENCRTWVGGVREYNGGLVFHLSADPGQLEVFEKTSILQPSTRKSSDKFLRFYLYCNEKREFSMGPITDPELGMTKLGGNGYFGWFVDGVFVTSSSDKTRPGLVVSKMPE